MKKILMSALIAAALPAIGQISAEQNPAGQGSLQPAWSVTQDGSPLLSWIEKSKDGSFALKYAIRKGNAWGEVHTVAAGRHFFRHPAEVPEIIQLPDGTLMAHWIENGQGDSDAEFAYVSASKDGVKWTTP